MARVRVSVGGVDVRLDGVEVSLRQVRGLMHLAAALSLAAAVESSDEDSESKAPIGFSAQVERLPEEILQEDISWYFDEKATGGHGKA
jgi:hypothetical protein